MVKILKYLLVAIMVFLAAFVLANYIFYDEDDEANQSINFKHEPMDVPENVEIAHGPIILPTTKVEQIILDQNGDIISNDSINSYSVMGYTQEQLLQIYPTYQIDEFNENNVVLSKDVYIEQEPTIYYLGIENNEIGIKLNDEFQKIGLQSDDFSSYENILLSHEIIAVSPEDKIKLEEDPYYIERMFQNLSE
ncbi:hypothetical protein AN641_08040 [Candidatus Epulonipiscioides gigas]|nr:hypothetical protein AN641_08040 [Epulopiscium sp. SCG-C07WGA-EpuloA2]